MTELQVILARLDRLTPEEQEQVQEWILEQQEKRKAQYETELWENVIAAISEYQKKIGNITVYCRNCGEYADLDILAGISPGCFSIG